MEYSSGSFGVSHTAAKTFLDNERGDTNEIVSNSNNDDVKDFIAEQSGNNSVNISGDNSVTLNTNSNKVEEKLTADNKDVSRVNKIEEDKFKDNKSQGISSGEEEDFVSIQNSKEELDLEFKNNEANNTVKPGTSKESEDTEWMDILGSGKLKKKTIKPGLPDTRPQKSDVCIIDVVGKLENGTVFEEKKCLEINLGDNETVQGLDFVLALMDKGEEADVIVASRFGYGTLGLDRLVPPDATLYYNLKLIDVKPEPLVSSLNIKERIIIGSRKKERGNFWYSRNEHSLAIHSYRRALEYFDDTEIPGEHTDEEVSTLLEERLKTFNNLGASQMKIFAYDAALISINNVLYCQPKNVKALFRKSKILKEKGELTKSIEVIRQALQIEPESKGLQQELSLLLAAQRKDNTLQRNLYKKMMGNSSSNDNETVKKKKSQYNSYKWVAAVSFAIAVLGAVAFKYRL